MSQEIDYQAEIAKCSTMEDITGPNGLIQKVIKDAVEQVLRKEVNGYIADAKENGNRVSKNGSSPKTIKTAYGKIGIDGHGNPGVSPKS